jgi:transcriptional regulator with XRE-family HTH domain
MVMTPATLLSWRTRLGFNKTEAAKALGLSRNGYDYYETGRHRIPLHIGLACKALEYNLPPIDDKPYEPAWLSWKLTD